ncbi:MAG: glycosyltransferase [Muribaculaceae bacterium]|nr:glycosyltransferase [Muribaculaceae bacterium]
MNPSKFKQQVIVSLTSFPAAIPYAGRAIQSILEGSVLPDKVVLYLTFSQFEEESIDVPQDLLKLAEENPRFEIRDYPQDIRSYRKLIPALIDFPDAVIVTIDDDVKYHRHMLRDLLRLHEEVPCAILAHRAKLIIPDKPYRKWRKYRWYHFLLKRIYSGYRNMQTGVGGVLYPPHSLKKEMLAVELFTELAPTTDDIWFWAAGVANDYPVVPVPFGYNKPKGLGKPHKLSLKTTNFKSGTDRNVSALKAVLERFPLVKQKMENDE